MISFDRGLSLGKAPTFGGGASVRIAQTAIMNIHRRWLSRPLPDRVAIYFHAVKPRQDKSFRRCIEFFLENGYAFVDAAGLCAPGFSKRIFLSFDDNFQSWCRLLDTLENLGVSVTFFVNTLPLRDIASPETTEAFFNRINYHGERVALSVGELLAIAEAGHVIGCHSHSHFVLSHLDRDSAEAEISGSKRILEALLKRPVVDFAYPFGMRRHFSNGLIRFCIESGFRTISTAISGLLYAEPRPTLIHRSSWDLDADLSYNLERLCIDGRFFERLTGRSAVLAPVSPVGQRALAG